MDFLHRKKGEASSLHLSSGLHLLQRNSRAARKALNSKCPVIWWSWYPCPGGNFNSRESISNLGTPGGQSAPNRNCRFFERILAGYWNVLNTCSYCIILYVMKAVRKAPSASTLKPWFHDCSCASFMLGDYVSNMFLRVVLLSLNHPCFISPQSTFKLQKSQLRWFEPHQNDSWNYVSKTFKNGIARRYADMTPKLLPSICLSTLQLTFKINSNICRHRIYVCCHATDGLDSLNWTTSELA